MDYIEAAFTIPGDFDPDILVAHLAELGFDSFTEEDGMLQAYIAADRFNESALLDLISEHWSDSGLGVGLRTIPSQNWNETWESAYEPVTVAGKCRVRAPFHAPDPSFQYDLVIAPKMSFGTAHHETTSLMLEMMMEEDLAGKRVLDMGCGTAVLAILAHKMGAAEVVAIDNDEWAISNAPENAAANNAPIRVIRGEASDIPSPGYDLIVANINRNVLIRDIPVYAGCLVPGGTLLLSGFYEDDLPGLREMAETNGLRYAGHRAVNRWTGAKFTR